MDTQNDLARLSASPLQLRSLACPWVAFLYNLPSAFTCQKNGEYRASPTRSPILGAASAFDMQQYMSDAHIWSLLLCSLCAGRQR